MPMTAEEAQLGSRMVRSPATTLPVVRARRTPLVGGSRAVALHVWRAYRRAIWPTVLKVGMATWGLVLLKSVEEAQLGSRMACSPVTTLPVVRARRDLLVVGIRRVELQLWQANRRAMWATVVKIGMTPWGLVLPMAVEGCPSGPLRGCQPVTTLPEVRVRRVPLVGWKMAWAKMAC